MPVQPIDLQTLFAHINQVGKQQANLKEGIILQQSAKGSELVKETEHKNESVNKFEQVNEENQEIKEKRSGSDERREKDGENGAPKEEKQQDKNYFTDPDLGRNIDISG